MGAVFQLEHEVLYYEADTTGKLALPMMLNLAILASTKQSLALGVGPDFNHAQGLGWVVLQYDVDVTRRPAVGETITVQTEAVKYNPFFAKRTFTLVDAQGAELIAIDSTFAMIDMNARRMARLPKEQMGVYQAERVKQIERMTDPTPLVNVDAQQAYKVRYLDIDSNQHVNNSKYFDWLFDVLSPEFVQTHEPLNIKIKFENEVRLGEIVHSQVQMTGQRTLHRVMNDDTVAAEAEVVWRD